MDYEYFKPSVSDDVTGESLYLTEDFIAQANHYLPKEVQGQGHENVVYIGGKIVGNQRFGFVLVAPSADTGPRWYNTTPKSHWSVVMETTQHDIEIIGQIHTHPGAIVSHSLGDDELAFTKGEGFWSLVVPNYCRQGMLPLAQCGIHCFENGKFSLLTHRAVEARVKIIPNVVDLR